MDNTAGVTLSLRTLLLVLLYHYGQYCWCYCIIKDIIVGVTLSLGTILLVLLYHYGHYCWC